MTRSHTNSRTTIHLRSAALLGALAMLAAACGDSSMGPAQQRAVGGGGVLHSRFDGSYSFTYDPAKGITTKLSDKAHSISIPAYGICDPATSEYGPGTWDLPCAALTTPIVITVNSYTDDAGVNPYVDFSPPLRFVPSKTTTLTFKMKKATVNMWSVIKYCVVDGSCVDESLTDPSLKTNNDGKGKISRRIKHFSGYNVAAGIECDPLSGDPDCIDLGDDLRLNRGTDMPQITVDAPSATAPKGKKKSGYMVVSGVEQ